MSNNEGFIIMGKAATVIVSFFVFVWLVEHGVDILIWVTRLFGM